MSSRNVTILCYWNGTLVDGPEGIGYSGGTSKLIRLPYASAYGELIDKIHSITGWDKRNFKVNIIGRFLTHSSPRHFVSTPIDDDESLAIMFDMYQRESVLCVEIYLEKEKINGETEQTSLQNACTSLRRIDRDTGQTSLPNTFTGLPRTDRDIGQTSLPNAYISVPRIDRDTGQTSLPDTYTSVLRIDRDTGQTSLPDTYTSLPRIDRDTRQTSPPNTYTSLHRIDRDTGRTSLQNTCTRLPPSSATENLPAPATETSPLPAPATENLGCEAGLPGPSSSDSRESSPSMSSQDEGVNYSIKTNHQCIGMGDYMRPIGGVHPGPIDASVLTDQQNHRSSDVWENKAGAQHHVLRIHAVHVWAPHPRLHRYIMDAGFLGMLMIESIPLDHALITALVERWRQETHTFHFPTGEMSITLQDVGLLLGLPIDGDAIIGNHRRDWIRFCETELGLMPGENDLNGSNLQLRWLRDNFSNLPEGTGDYNVKRFAKAWMLGMIGAVLCPSKDGESVSLSYLSFLQDLKKVRNYSWGGAVLANLYRGMCRASKRGAKELSGCALLLQLWSWERLNIGRPSLRVTRDQNGGNEDANRVVLHPDIANNAYTRPPHGYRWTQPKSYENPNRGLHYYRVELDLQEDNDVTWQPYNGMVEADISPLCLEGCHIWRARVPLICLDVIEWHFPDRVMRQFGLTQKVPQPCDTESQLHEIDEPGRSQINWRPEHESYFKKWHDRLKYVVSADRLGTLEAMLFWDGYMKWYRSITRRVVARLNVPSQGEPSFQCHGKSGMSRTLDVGGSRSLEDVAYASPSQPRFRQNDIADNGLQGDLLRSSFGVEHSSRHNKRKRRGDR